MFASLPSVHTKSCQPLSCCSRPSGWAGRQAWIWLGGLRLCLSEPLVLPANLRTWEVL